MSEPITADVFIATGADPATATELARQHNLLAGFTGSSDVRYAALATVADGVPQLSAEAKAAQQWAADKELAAVVTSQGEQLQEVQLLSGFNEMVEPPAESWQYQFPHDFSHTPTDAENAADTELRTALHSSRVPQFVAENIGKSLADAARSIQSMEALEARNDETRSTLERMYGESFESNIAAGRDLLKSWGNASPALARFIEQASPYLGPIDVDLIVQTALHRKRGG